MEKAKNKVLKFFPKALSFQNPPFSPSRDKDAPTRSNARFSGPIVSLVPREARRTPDTNQEPTSPKVSCLGQIKQRRGNKCKGKDKLVDGEGTRRGRKETKKGKKEDEVVGRMSVKGRAPPELGQMRRFASSRSSLSNFDWTAQVAPGEEEEVVVDRVAFSAPLELMPKKEINLWKRRTMEAPRPLDLGPPHS